MKHIILNVTDQHPYQILDIELIGESDSEKNEIFELTQSVQDYLLLSLETVEIITTNPPFFTIRRTKMNIGFS